MIGLLIFKLKHLTALYLQIGNKTVQCYYGIERTNVSTHFQNEDLQMTGFSVSIPAGYFVNEYIKVISFI